QQWQGMAARAAQRTASPRHEEKQGSRKDAKEARERRRVIDENCTSTPIGSLCDFASLRDVFSIQSAKSGALARLYVRLKSSGTTKHTKYTKTRHELEEIQTGISCLS